MTKPNGTDWKPVFLEEFARTGNVSAAAQKAGISRNAAYKARDVDPVFCAQWDEAREIAADLLEAEARRRAVEGIERPVFFQGKQVGVVMEYSDALLVVLLKANRPLKFRENTRIEHAGDSAAPIKHEHTVTVIDRINQLRVAIEAAATRNEGIAPEATAGAKPA